MKKYKKIIALAISLPFLGSLTSCQDMFEPAIENHKAQSDLLNMPAWATGLLGHAYISNPLGSWRFDDVATDDAVTNVQDNNYRKMALGAWRSNNNAQDNWQNLRASWQYINQFLEIVDGVNWAADPISAEMFKKRFKGDAYGMRALYMYHLLLHHAGYAEDGTLLGIPILLQSENLTSDYNLPRNTFKECIAQLNSDVDKAIELLPEEYGDIENNADVPAKYKGATASQYSRVFGNAGKNRMSARIARAIRAQAALLAASPAYSQGSEVTWATAADYMAEVLSALGSNPISKLDPKGNEWYKDGAAIKDAEAGVNIPEMLWRSNRAEDADIEGNQYPPSLFGKGQVNPTQNLVDAFPMLNGLPISDPNSGYNANNPYENRDPRLKKYILVNGEKAGPQNKVINTTFNNNSDNKDGMSKIETSTVTGYYLKKLLCQSANPDPNSTNKTYHYKPFIRYTEIFLGYAEAANEAWGPKERGSHGYSAYDVIKAIRERAGICVNVADKYLDECATSKEKMRALIHNERRLELCFEGFRFYDIRRWKEDMNVTAKGMKIVENTYSIVNVEERKYQDYMYYGPVPQSEVLKYSNLFQNKGWQ